MRKNNHYIVAVCVYERGGHVAELASVRDGQDIMWNLGIIGGLVSARIMPTKQAAIDEVDRLNRAYKAQGIHIDDLEKSIFEEATA